MAERYRETVSDRELFSRILSTIDRLGEVKESDLYDLCGTSRRIKPMLKELIDCGALKIEYKKQEVSGRWCNVYSFTDKGQVIRLTNRLENLLMNQSTELDMETGEVRQTLDNIRAILDVQYGYDEKEGE